MRYQSVLAKAAETQGDEVTEAMIERLRNSEDSYYDRVQGIHYFSERNLLTAMRSACVARVELLKARRASLPTPAETQGDGATPKMIERVRCKAHQMWAKHDSMAMQGATNNAMHYSIEADNKRHGADWALDELLTAMRSAAPHKKGE